MVLIQIWRLFLEVGWNNIHHLKEQIVLVVFLHCKGDHAPEV